jgi:hypothetical protein
MRLTKALGIEQSPTMEMRRMKITEGARVWVQTPAGQLAAPGWENGHEATAIRINREGLIPMITARDAMGREITVPHYELLAGYEHLGNADWVPETDPRVLDWLESEVKRGSSARIAAQRTGTTTNRAWREMGRSSDGTDEFATVNSADR